MEASLIGGSSACTPSREGTKAATLGALTRAGFAVPPFFVISASALTDDGLRSELRESLCEHLRDLGPGPYAVRSSAREEDGAHHSYAGQFASLLNVPAETLEAAALKVWRSGNTDGLVAYRKAHRLDPAALAPAVIVQRMVQARAAGVTFSADPVSGRPDRIVIAAVPGLADRLLSGEVDGYTYVIDRATGTILKKPEHEVLSRADLSALTTQVYSVEEAQNAPQDIEWAFEGDGLYLLQSRPITSKAHSVPDDRLTIFDNSNIVESYPGLVSPLTYSFAQYAYARVYRTFVRLLGVREGTIRRHAALFDNMLGLIDGRVYYNLINWYRMLAMLPGFASNRGHMEAMMGVDEPLPPSIAESIVSERPRGFARFREYLCMAKVAFRLAAEAMRMNQSIRAFQTRLNQALATDVDRLDAVPLSALADEYRRIESELLERWDAPLVNDFLCMMAFGLSRKLLKRWAGESGLELHNEAMIGQGDIISAEPVRRIAYMGALASGNPDVVAALAKGNRSVVARDPRLAMEIESYMAKFGDRCTEELKLESITLREDPQPLFAAIAASAASPVATRCPRLGSMECIDAQFTGKPFRRFIVRRVLTWAKARVRDRENLRFERTRVFGRARRLFIAIGRQLHLRGAIDHPRDVFMLTVAEVLGAVEGFATTTDLRGLVAVRKAEMERWQRQPDPARRLIVTGAVGFRTTNGAATVPSHQDVTLCQGTGCSAGTVRGRAHVVRNPRTELLQPAEILVAHHTDPGWIALFANASAIVVERGSLLSHSAIVAREIGIPCVVGLKGATDWLRTGEMIEVNGAAGTVRKLDG